MFSDFFELLRLYGLKVSIPEWMTLVEGLKQNLHGASLTGFYYLARAVLVKSESEFDRFDSVFLYYFKNVVPIRELPPELEEWLSRPMEQNPYDKDEVDKKFGGMDLEEIMRQFEARMKEQHEIHNGGGYWIGTGGTSLFGHSGYNPNGIRIGGTGRSRSAVQIAAERRFRDYREDAVLDVRQFQLAFRRLRQLSTRDNGPKDVLDLDETIQQTCDQAGRLKLVFDRPRKNMVKVLLLFDSGGSMDEYRRLCAQLFQGADKSNHFKDLKVFFFHNCFYDDLFTDPSCLSGARVSTRWVLQTLGPDYKVIVVGDAYMSPYELFAPNGCIDYYTHNEEPGIAWIEKFVRRYPNMIWLNPIEPEYWRGHTTIAQVQRSVPMYPLSVQGLEDGMKQLMAVR